MSDANVTFRADPLWLIDALADDLKQICRINDAPEKDALLYEQGLTLIGRAIPSATLYALEAFQGVLADRITMDKKPPDLRRRTDSTTRDMLMNLMVVLQLLQSEDDRRHITQLMEFVGKWPEQYLCLSPEKATEAPQKPQVEAEKQPDAEIQRCASESYREMKARQQKEINAFPMAFAFGRDQLVEGMRRLGLAPSETDKVVSIGAGGFIRRNDEAAYHAMFRRHRLEHKAAMDADKTGNGYLLQMFRCELSNHEYGYTRDAEPALMALGLSWEDVGDDERLLHAFEKACRQEADWYDKHC